jgi:hypothetical protein
MIRRYAAECIPEGCRELKRGEYLEEGDLFFRVHNSTWQKVGRTRNAKYRIRYNPDKSDFIIRRIEVIA